MDYKQTPGEWLLAGATCRFSIDQTGESTECLLEDGQVLYSSSASVSRVKATVIGSIISRAWRLPIVAVPDSEQYAMGFYNQGIWAHDGNSTAFYRGH